jgi:cell division control protein 45
MVLIDKERFADEFEALKNDALAYSSSVLILVAPDVDALCCCRILTTLLQSECVPYKVKPVSGYDGLVTVNQSILADTDGDANLRAIVLLNCGGIIDIQDFFQLHNHANPDGTYFSFIVMLL